MWNKEKANKIQPDVIINFQVSFVLFRNFFLPSFVLSSTFLYVSHEHRVKAADTCAAEQMILKTEKKEKERKKERNQILFIHKSDVFTDSEMVLCNGIVYF